MKALVFHGTGDIRVDDVPEPKIEHPNDAIVRLTASAICGTDLHFVRGTMPVEPGTVLGHEGVGVVEECGENVRNLNRGDRVVIPSTIGCGTCSYCRAGYYAQCDHANPNGPQAGTAFYGGPKSTGPFDGLQAEYARIPYANVGLVKLPDGVSDEQAILLSDIVPTGYFGAQLAEVAPDDVVAVFGCGPVGQFAIASAQLSGAGRVLAVDREPSRLEMARAQGAEIVNFEREEPVQMLRAMTRDIGPDRVIDAVGVDAEPRGGGDPDRLWQPGQAPAQAAAWCVESVAKAGTVSVIGVYPPSMDEFPLGQAMNKNLSVNMGNCNHRRYLPELVRQVSTGVLKPERVLTQQEPVTSAVDAYAEFDRRRPGWMKVELQPAPARV